MLYPDPVRVGTVAIIGAGTIGASWAALCLAHGLTVNVYDPAPDSETSVRRYVDHAWPALQRLGLAAKGDPGRISFHAEPEGAAAGADFVQESALERVELKQELFARIDAVVPPDRVIASSTSTFVATSMNARMRHGQRLVVGHPFNPPHLIPLVEVVGGEGIDPVALDWAMAFYRTIGKHPIRLNKPKLAHVANRLQAALWREAVNLVNEGVASVSDVDAAIAYGPGLRWAVMGPNLIFHLAAGSGGMEQFLKHLAEPIQSHWDDLGAPRFTPEVKQRLIEGVAEEAAGRSVAELVAERDRCLQGILEVLARERRG